MQPLAWQQRWLAGRRCPPRQGKETRELSVGGGRESRNRGSSKKSCTLANDEGLPWQRVSEREREGEGQKRALFPHMTAEVR